MERWKRVTVKPFGHYSVSTQGRVKNNFTGRILKLGTDTSGYHFVILQKAGKKANFKVHKLVALAFIGEPEEGQEVHHINGVRTDNSLENLQWIGRKENLCEAYLSSRKRKEREHKSLLASGFCSIAHASEKTGIPCGTIWNWCYTGQLPAQKQGRIWTISLKFLKLLVKYGGRFREHLPRDLKRSNPRTVQNKGTRTTHSNAMVQHNPPRKRGRPVLAGGDLAKGYYTIQQVSEQIKLTPQTLRNWIRTGMLPATKKSGQWVITENHFRHLMEHGTDGAWGEE